MKTSQLAAAAAAALALALAGFSGAASAQATASVSADVSVTFTAKCQIASGSSATVAIDFGTYTAFGANVTAPTKTATYECSRGMGAAPTFTWDANPDGATVQGTVKGLRYQLTASTALATGGAGAAPDLVAKTNGTPDTYDIKIDGTLYGGAGDPTGSATASNTLVVTY